MLRGGSREGLCFPIYQLGLEPRAGHSCVKSSWTGSPSANGELKISAEVGGEH